MILAVVVDGFVSFSLLSVAIGGDSSVLSRSLILKSIATSISGETVSFLALKVGEDEFVRSVLSVWGNQCRKQDAQWLYW